MNDNLSEEDFGRILTIFQSIDKNSDGEITVAELRQALISAGQDYTLKDVQKIVKKVDRNGDGRVAWEEFLALMSKKKESVKKVGDKGVSGEEYSRAIEAFKIFDKNNDGVIDMKELMEAMKELQLEEDPKKVEKLLKDLDKNGDGSIDYEEFASLLGL